MNVGVIFLTSRDRNKISRWVNKDKLFVIENASPYPAKLEDKFVRHKIALAIGRLCHQKGFDRLIDIWLIIRTQAPDWKLFIIGDGPDYFKLKNKISNAGLSQQVFLLPATQNISDYYNKASLYLMTSYYEGLPMVLIEAMSFGLAIVAYDCQTGPAELITNGRNGFLISDGNREEFCRRTLEIIHNPIIHKEFSRASLEISNRFSPEKIYEKWINIVR